jgi:hypothetical protein
MSSDPDRFPIEPDIVPLVYAFHSLLVCRPCWSCEGHLGPDGALGRVPSVWFYAGSVVYPRLIDEHVGDLGLRRDVENDWRVSVTVADVTNPYTTFSLEPSASSGDDGDLDALRRDARTIADGLVDGIRGKAREVLERLHSKSTAG